jgi:O-acetyl-ADP-ribose deacetylase (regulator of RNase III)
MSARRGVVIELGRGLGAGSVSERSEAELVATLHVPGGAVLEFVLGDLTKQTVDAIVNPVGPGLVDQAVRRAAGPQLVDAFHEAAGNLPEEKLLAGRALVTAGFALPARQVIHVRPPVYADGPAAARRDLADCHRAALRAARESGLRSIALPAVGTGVYRFPVPEAAELALDAVISELSTERVQRTLRFVFKRHTVLEWYLAAAKRRLEFAATSLSASTAATGR